MKKLMVTKPFKIDGDRMAEVGDTVTVKSRGSLHYDILKLNDKPIYSIWKFKTWVKAHTQEI